MPTSSLLKSVLKNQKPQQSSASFGSTTTGTSATSQNGNRENTRESSRGGKHGTSSSCVPDGKTRPPSAKPPLPHNPSARAPSPAATKIACVCAPTKHAGSFRCRLHRGGQFQWGAGSGRRLMNLQQDHQLLPMSSNPSSSLAARISSASSGSMSSCSRLQHTHSASDL
ncbi:hypothetical protein BDL97_16G035100 [Sphagnum fallax]|nr:hypothetical protein BDL97_16G035100 [Sphagnum fallax]